MSKTNLAEKASEKYIPARIPDTLAKEYPPKRSDAFMIQYLKDNGVRVTINNICGNNLAGKDLGNTSDPYLKIGWVKKFSDALLKKEQVLLQTQPIKKTREFSLSNIFTEPLEFELGHVLRVEVWDWNLMLAHAWMGSYDFDFVNIIAVVSQCHPSYSDIWKTMDKVLKPPLFAGPYELQQGAGKGKVNGTICMNLTFTPKAGTETSPYPFFKELIEIEEVNNQKQRAEYEEKRRKEDEERKERHKREKEEQAAKAKKFLEEFDGLFAGFGTAETFEAEFDKLFRSKEWIAEVSEAQTKKRNVAWPGSGVALADDVATQFNKNLVKVFQVLIDNPTLVANQELTKRIIHFVNEINKSVGIYSSGNTSFLKYSQDKLNPNFFALYYPWIRENAVKEGYYFDLYSDLTVKNPYGVPEEFKAWKKEMVFTPSQEAKLNGFDFTQFEGSTYLRFDDFRCSNHLMEKAGKILLDRFDQWGPRHNEILSECVKWVLRNVSKVMQSEEFWNPIGQLFVAFHKKRLAFSGKVHPMDSEMTNSNTVMLVDGIGVNYRVLRIFKEQLYDLKMAWESSTYGVWYRPGHKSWTRGGWQYVSSS